MGALAFRLDQYPEPTPAEIDAAREAARVLSAASMHRPMRIAVAGMEPSDPIELPPAIFRQVLDLLIQLGNGITVTIMPVEAELTTSQSADLLGVSRPHLIKLIGRGELGCRLVGTHRKLRVREVIAYRDKTDLARTEALGRMAELDAELGLDVDEPVGTDSAA